MTGLTKATLRQKAAEAAYAVGSPNQICGVKFRMYMAALRDHLIARDNALRNGNPRSTQNAMVCAQLAQASLETLTAYGHNPGDCGTAMVAEYITHIQAYASD